MSARRSGTQCWISFEGEDYMNRLLILVASLCSPVSYAGVDPLRVLESENSFTNFIAIAVIVLIIIFGAFGSK